MGRSQETFSKKEVTNRKEKKRKEKEKKRLAKKDNETSGKLEDMIAYVDEFGNLTSTPPDPTKKREIKKEEIEINIPKQDALPEDDGPRKGVVTFFNDSKGYGFIKDSVTKESVFVHINNVDGNIKENNMVTYEVEMREKGPTATNVKVTR
ncbi:cold shock domain-containing protein [Chondrinema litorale]|uniref:cold shock domain-containing protein n=1 Tax=Chondrinema litorale TaxID=2994555 RepID=UPI002542D0A0|nr:cold shock domain-containing protein [Chondrinema litorale]UZR93813.1 cold shock domain-containing protein [Chondrinema litorale]